MELLFVAVFLQLSSPCFGYPTGAPTSTCEDMMPRHAGVQPQPIPAPYTILTSARKFQTGKPVTVTITGSDYKGVLLEARSAASQTALGTWGNPPTNTKFLKCSGNAQGAITHANTNTKDSTTTFSWIPPNINSTIYFMATVAQERTVYWLNIRSETLTRESGGIDLAAGGHPGMAGQGFLKLFALCLLVLLITPR
ncbi:putative defense protein 3 [Esox lucius]|uniref:Reelin domain-containing protein n=1 Tax=Esox lucius TaxID=8010 RepID=A0A3P8Z2M1_ESOLU|nr:putative defense protein 3 [Esox lucius]